MNENHLPITNICLIAKPNNVPTGFECIRKTFDDPNKDADLMADSLLERKDRFLCITRNIGNVARPVIVEDIKVINERDPPPHNYLPLIQTNDTREKATQKKTICVKLAERQPGMKCICDIIFLYKSRRPPTNYSIIGDINNLQICIQEGTVPPYRPAPTPPNAYPSLPYPVDPGFMTRVPTFTSQQSEHGALNTIKKSDEKEALEGIPFEINPKYLNSLKSQNSQNNLKDFENFQLLTGYDIEQSYRYDFNVERTIFHT